MMGGWGYGPNMMGGAWGGNGYWWMGLLGMLIQALFWIAIIILAVRLFKNLGSRNLVGGYRDSALDILRDRYARGEIDLEEFQRRKHEIQKP